MKMRIKANTSKINIVAGDIVVEIPKISFEVETEYSMDEITGIYDLTKTVMKEMPDAIAKFVIDLDSSFETISGILDVKRRARDAKVDAEVNKGEEIND